MKKPPPEAKRGRATDRVKEGYGNAVAAIAASHRAKPDRLDGARRSQNRELMDKNRIPRPTRRDELAQHGEVVWYARGGTD